MTKEFSVEELRAKVALGSMLIEMLEQEDDPRAAAAVKVLQGQQQQLEEMIKPPPIVVGCKSAVLSARAKGSPAQQPRQEDLQVVEMISGDDGNITLTLQY